MKVAMLIPCLMQDNNRKANKTAMHYAQQYYNVDEFVVNDQCFQPEDYEDGFTYVGHHAEKQGFVNTRNQLLQWFYQSDYDYAIWMDANARVSKTSLNDLDTLLEVAKSGELQVDAVLTTLGIMVSGERISAKSSLNYFDRIYLSKVNGKVSYEWMHGLLMKNFKKFYGQEIYIDSRCNPKVGTSEDIFFVKMLKRLFDVRLCPTITITKPSNKTSTWVADKTGYAYPKVDNATIDTYVEEAIKANGYVSRPKTLTTYEYARTENYKDLLKPYKPRVKTKSKSLL